MFVYILYSEERSRYYVGQTTDITNRLKRHNLGIVPSTKSGVPWKLVLQIEVLSRSEAMVLERRIKKRGAKRFIDDHFGVYHAYGVAGLARLAKPKALLSRRVWDAEVVTLWA
ncbi:GIY-YIG catalytic domain-containing protein [Arenibacter algicola]|jgi:putative endonuclease|uniref:GIY-YIG catalytic domain-containing protein n=1 Tax=Arenibacter algicola TaxID=616991 RepID=A0ABY3A8Z4_9FLAO